MMKIELKTTWSVINKNITTLLEDKTKCHGCPFATTRYSNLYCNDFEDCSHPYFKLNVEYGIKHNERPKECSLTFYTYHDIESRRERCYLCEVERIKGEREDWVDHPCLYSMEYIETGIGCRKDNEVVQL